MNNNPIRCFLIAQEFFMQKILSFFKIEKQNEKIHHFNPHAPHVRQDTREETLNQYNKFVSNIYTIEEVVFYLWVEIVLFDERAIL